ncbi:MAG: SpoIIE family protein phosphatase [Deltaproteobacteria bacterium]|jgi:serine phosphatase RsbU (regulator of sigma subunit)|nr:SpoIIE family protein phosphatase [Deltaproteobacteria bacterium]
MSKVDYYLVKRALTLRENDCGDTGIIQEFNGQCFLALVDVLGHGSEAHAVALRAQKYLRQNYRQELIAVMDGLHECLRGTRGAVAALCRLDTETGELIYVGVGNITVRVLGPRNSRFVSRDGIVGYTMSTLKAQTLKLFAGDVLVMYSDGIKEHFEPSDCRGILMGNAKSIAVGLLNQFGKKNDDASCIALRYLGDTDHD